MNRKHERERSPISGIQLPDISGLAVTKLLKDDETLKSIPIIAVTAFALEGDEEKMLNGGCDAYVPKPISVPKFLQTPERLVDRSGTRLCENVFLETATKY